MTTIVTAFINGVNSCSEIDKYYEWGKHILCSSIYKVVFLDDVMYKKVIDKNEYNKDTTTLIQFEKKDMYFYKEDKYILPNFALNTDNPNKDTIDYIFTQCHKTEWVKLAIELNMYNTNQFIWVDFGIRKIFNCSDEEFTKKMNHLSNAVYSHVRIGNIWPLNIEYNVNINKQICWYFAGGVFGGDKNQLVYFAEKMKTKCIEMVEKEKTLIWEVNIWYMIYKKNKLLFEPYACDHNNSIIDNY